MQERNSCDAIKDDKCISQIEESDIFQLNNQQKEEWEHLQHPARYVFHQRTETIKELSQQREKNSWKAFWIRQSMKKEEVLTIELGVSLWIEMASCKMIRLAVMVE